MKYLIAFLAFLQFGCSQQKSNPFSAKKSTIERTHITFEVGDIDNNGKKDKATVAFNFDYATQQVVCKRKFCPIIIQFDNKIPSLEIDNSRSVYVEKIDDINNDNATEILVFSLTK